MLTQEWSQPVDAEHRTFKGASDVKDQEGHVLVTAYAVLRPDGQWSLLLINKDYDNPHPVRIVFQDGKAQPLFRRTGHNDHISERHSISGIQQGREGYADPDGPAITSSVEGAADAQYALPPASMTVLRGRIN